MTVPEVLDRLKKLANPKNVEGMARFGIAGGTMLGISVTDIRKIARQYKKDHQLAQELWDSGIHEARILAGFVDDPKLVTEAQMERWVKDFDSWDVCDQVCMHLFDKTPLAKEKALEWSTRHEEFTKRAGFALMAAMALGRSKLADSDYDELLVAIKKAATDDRNFVKKAVNWALRQIGKRNKVLNKQAIAVAQEIQKLDSKAAKWIAADALRELTSEKVQLRLK